MVDVDFEKIRTDSLKKVVGAVPKNDAYGKLVHAYAEVASKVTKEMLTEFYQQFSQDH